MTIDGDRDIFLNNFQPDNDVKMTGNRRFLALLFIVTFISKFLLLVNIKNNDKNPKTNRRNNGEKK